MIGLGPTIGPTIFVVPRTAVDLAGPSSLVTLIVAGVITLITALNYAHMSSMLPVAGGGYSFSNKAFGGFGAFVAGWLMWIGSTAYISLSAITFGLALTKFFPVTSPLIIAILTIAFFTAVNFVGVKEAGRTQVILMFFVAAVLVAFATIGIPFVDHSNFEPFYSKGFITAFTSIGYVYTVFVGFEVIANVSEEVKRAIIIVPRAIMLTILIALALFPTILFVLIGIMSQQSIISSDTPLVDASANIFGPLGPPIMVAAAMIASLASLNGAIIASSRTLFAIGRDRHLPAVLSAVQRRFRTPYLALLISSALALLMLYTMHIDELVYATDFGYILGLTVINAAAIVLPKKLKDVKAPFRLPLHPLVPVLATVTTIAIVPTISIETLTFGLIITGIGIAANLIYRAKK
jgi:APA family basic amino acid/polyamine antiporter